MTRTFKLLLMLVNENDVWHGRPLYQAMVERLHQLNIAGATVQTGIMGFGHHMRLHHKGLFGIADDRPMTILVVDEEERIRSVLPEMRRMIQGGIIALVDTEIIGGEERSTD